MQAKTKIKIQVIKDGINAGKNTIEIAKELQLTKQAISELIHTYIPEFKKSNRKLPKKETRQRNDLERIQRQKVTNKRSNALKTGYEWNLDYSDISWPTHCPILGLELDYFAETRKENSVSFDRVDTNLGYIKGNVHIISWRANRIKNDGSLEEHKKIVCYLEKTKFIS